MAGGIPAPAAFAASRIRSRAPSCRTLGARLAPWRVGQSAEQAVATGRPEHPPELADRPTDAEADMLAKRFFYVAAGILCLALTYHLGARSAGAQAGGGEGMGIDDTGSGGSGAWASACVNRIFYSMHPAASGEPLDRFDVAVPVPGTSPVVGTTCFGWRSAVVLLANGEIWGSNGDRWEYGGNLFGGATPAQQESFGSLKAKYRGER